jgi:hypothetical protein
MLPISTIDLAFHNSVPQTAFGIFMIGLVLSIDGFAFTAIISFFRSSVGQKPHPSKVRSTFFFVVCTQLLALTQLLSICIWALSVWMLGILPSWFTALHLSASSYTTLGDFPVKIADGWHMIPVFIAFSGLFSFAWSASSTMSMVSSLNSYLDTTKNSTL